MKVWDRAGIELATPGFALRLASVARHITDCATRPGIIKVIDNLVQVDHGICIILDEVFLENKLFTNTYRPVCETGTYRIGKQLWPS